MPSQQIIQLRDRILAILMRNARERRHATPEECAQVLGKSVDQYKDYETGADSISLPELELLGHYLEIPLHILRDEDISSEKEYSTLEAASFLFLRNRIIGARLRQARLAANYTQKEVAEVLGCAASTISACEYGRRAISLAELEVLARELRTPLTEFLDQESQVGAWHRRQKEFEIFCELSPEVREFVLYPINQSYLEIAMHLAALPAGALRQIAESLLEITY
ncbi:MAG: helix-turn-helix transcriptional regulator [Chloroflexota bacterium]|nr:helix-turn-helix transcriptional regulator [Chloroflexota bacterium]